MSLATYIYKVEEVEVWDKEVDIANPVYFYGERNWDILEDRYLAMLEDWFFELDYEYIRNDGDMAVVFADCYGKVEEYIANAPWLCVGLLKECYMHYDDDEIAAAFVEDIFTVLSQGYGNVAKQFCRILNLKEEE